MNAEISETIRATILGLGMQIPEKKVGIRISGYRVALKLP